MNWLANILLSKYSNWRNLKFDNSKIYDWKNLKDITDTYFRLRSDKLVISIGNLTFGGTGKTPCIETIVKNYLPQDSSVCIVERGYNRKSPIDVILEANNYESIDVNTVGDEPLMLFDKLKVPISISQSKFQAFHKAIERLNPEIIIIDDGFQHRWIVRDLDILIIDPNTIENPHFPPKGRLREPLSSISRANIILYPEKFNEFVKQKISKDIILLDYRIFEGEVYSCEHNIEPDKITKLIAVSGIANTERFYGSLKKKGIEIIDKIKFPDHHNYSIKDIEKLIYNSKKNNSSIITTEKDFVKLKQYLDYFNSEKIELFVLPIKFEILDAENLLRTKINEIYQQKILGIK